MKGHIRERPPGSSNWYAVVDVRDAATGNRKRKWHSLEAKGKREAQIECARLISALTTGTFLEPSKTAMAAYLERWLEHIKTQVSPRSYERYAEIVRKNLVPAIGSVILSKLQPAQISAAYAKALESGRRDGKGGLSPSSVHHMHRILKPALRQAVKWQLLPRNPADAVEPPKVEGREMQTYDMRQTAELLEIVRPTRMLTPTVLAVLCGLRRGEISALRWRNVDFTACQLAVVASVEQMNGSTRLKETKSGRARTVALPATVVEELKAWRTQQAQELLRLGIRPDGNTFVCTQADGPMQPTYITHEWVKLINGTGLPRIRFHDLRHAHATHLLASGVHPKVASERLGHSKVGITLDLYSHVMPGMQEDAVAKVGAALRAAKPK
jgi:integrase